MVSSNYLFGTAVSATPTTRKTNIRCFTPTASFPLPPSSRPARRRNYLRQKLLKTLKKPPPGTVTPTPPLEPVEEPARQVEELKFETERSRDQNPPESTSPIVDDYNINSAEEVEASTSASIIEAPRMRLPRALGSDVFKYGAIIVGFYFVVCALAGSDEENRRKNEEKKSRNGTVGEKFRVMNGQPLDSDGAEIEAKIAQIRIMAREARENERKSSINRESGLVDIEETDDEEDTNDKAEDDSSSVGSEIKKEVVGRLSSVGKKLNSRQASILKKKPQDLSENDVEDVVDKKDEARNLTFRKSYRIRSNLTPQETNHKPKGFGSSGAVDSSGNIDSNNHMNRRTRENGNGHVRGRSVAPLEDSGAAKRIEPKRSLNHSDVINDVSSSTKGKSKIRQAGTEGSLSKISDKHPNKSSDLWWHSLPYLLVIVMTEGSEDQGRRGFYTLEKSSDAYTVLFEDQNDAKNFAHILESYFEELGDIRISVMPLPIETLMEVMEKSRPINVIVVKKGQLKLYAGQPLTEVETALRSLL